MLTDQGGNKLARFSASCVKRVLLNPVRPTYDAKNKDYAMVQCEEAETFLVRIGVGKKNFSLTLVYWDTADTGVSALEEEFEYSNIDEAIKIFLKKCKRSPLYGDALT